MYVIEEDGVEIARTNDVSSAIEQIKTRRRVKVRSKAGELLELINEEDIKLFEEEYGWDTKFSLQQMRDSVKSFFESMNDSVIEKNKKIIEEREKKGKK